MSGGHAFFYEGGGRREAVDALFEGIHHADPVVRLVGAPGCGRSMVLDRFVAEADPEVLVIARITGDILMSDAQCFDALALALGGPQASGDARATLTSAIAQSRVDGRAPVLVIDDAHELGEEARAAVVTLARDVGVALVLAGDDTLLAGGTAAHADVPVVVLRPFTEEETEDFVAAWLAVGDEDELPSHRAMARLYRQSGGLPGRLTALLEGGAAERTALLPAGFPVWHVVFTVLAVFVLSWLLLRDGVGEPVAVAAEPEEIVVPLPRPEGLVAGGGGVVPDAGGAASPAVTPATEAGAPKAVERYTPDEKALLAEPQSRVTLQLFASFNDEAVRQFRLKHPSLAIRLFRTTREDLPWYVAVAGIYRNKDEARASVSRLPADVQALKPWARSLQGVQDELRRRKD